MQLTAKTSLIVLGVITGLLGLAAFQNQPSTFQTSHLQDQTKSINQQIKATTPQKYQTASKISTGTFDVVKSETTAKKELTPVFQDMFGKVTSISKLKANANKYQALTGNYKFVQALEKQVILQHDNAKYYLIAQKNNGIYMSFGKVNQESLTVPMTVFVDFTQTADGAKSHMGATYSLTYNLQKQAVETYHAKVRLVGAAE